MFVCADEDEQLDVAVDGEDDLGKDEDDDDDKEADALDEQVQVGSGANGLTQQQLAACLANTGVIAALKGRVKELAGALAIKTRQLVAAEQANILLHGVELDNMKLEAKMQVKDEAINRLKLQLVTLRRKAVSHANAIQGA